MTKVQIRDGCHHAGFQAGEIIEVTDGELLDFGDKFIPMAPGAKAKPTESKSKSKGKNKGG